MHNEYSFEVELIFQVRELHTNVEKKKNGEIYTYKNTNIIVLIFVFAISPLKIFQIV